MEVDAFTAYIKSSLTASQRAGRIKHVLTLVDTRNKSFFDQLDTLHVDESWFYLFNKVGKEDGWNIQVTTQPAQSPDFNVNDVGLFASLKSLEDELMKDCKTLMKRSDKLGKRMISTN